MKEWLRKLIVIVFIFVMIYIILSNVINIEEDIKLPKGAIINTTANKNIAICSLSGIVTCVIIEIYTIIKYINNTVNHETFKSNLLKLIGLTVAFMAICFILYYIYFMTSVTRYQMPQ